MAEYWIRKRVKLYGRQSLITCHVYGQQVICLRRTFIFIKWVVCSSKLYVWSLNGHGRQQPNRTIFVGCVQSAGPNGFFCTLAAACLVCCVDGLQFGLKEQPADRLHSLIGQCHCKWFFVSRSLFVAITFSTYCGDGHRTKPGDAACSPREAGDMLKQWANMTTLHLFSGLSS
jgi:hypothetical protein